MTHQVARRARHATALEIGRACHPQPPHVADRRADSVEIGKRADPQGDVDPLVDEVDVAVVQHQLDLDAGMRVEEARDDRRDVAAAELHRRGDAQQPAHRRVARADRRRLVVGDERARLVVEARPASVGASRRVVRSISARRGDPPVPPARA